MQNNEKFTFFYERKKNNEKCTTHTHQYERLFGPYYRNCCYAIQLHAKKKNSMYAKTIVQTILAHFAVILFCLSRHTYHFWGWSFIVVVAVDKIKRWFKPLTKRVNVGTPVFDAFYHEPISMFSTLSQIPLTKDQITPHTQSRICFLPNFDHFHL